MRLIPRRAPRPVLGRLLCRLSLPGYAESAHRAGRVALQGRRCPSHFPRLPAASQLFQGLTPGAKTGVFARGCPRTPDSAPLCSCSERGCREHAGSTIPFDRCLHASSTWGAVSHAKQGRWGVPPKKINVFGGTPPQYENFLRNSHMVIFWGPGPSVVTPLSASRARRDPSCRSTGASV